jgi:hypothetical protein
MTEREYLREEARCENCEHWEPNGRDQGVCRGADLIQHLGMRYQDTPPRHMEFAQLVTSSNNRCDAHEWDDDARAEYMREWCVTWGRHQGQTLEQINGVRAGVDFPGTL